LPEHKKILEFNAGKQHGKPRRRRRASKKK
jgi:hypothetical protein